MFADYRDFVKQRKDDHERARQEQHERRRRFIESISDVKIRREFERREAEHDRDIRDFWRTFRRKVRPDRKRVARDAVKKAKLDLPRRVPLASYSAPVRDRFKRLGVFMSASYLGALTARHGCASRLVYYITKPDSVEYVDDEAAVVSNMGEDRHEMAAGMDVVEDANRAARANAKVAVTIILQLPHDVTPAERLQILKTWCEEELGVHGLPYVAALHRPNPDGDQRNNHAHIVTSFRPAHRTGRYEWTVARAPRTDLDNPDTFRLMREDFATIMTAVSLLAGHDREYTALSHAGRGLKHKPTENLGADKTRRVRNGEYVAANERNRRIIAVNEAREAIDRLDREEAAIKRDIARLRLAQSRVAAAIVPTMVAPEAVAVAVPREAPPAFKSGPPSRVASPSVPAAAVAAESLIARQPATVANVDAVKVATSVAASPSHIVAHEPADVGAPVLSRPLEIDPSRSCELRRLAVITDAPRRARVPAVVAPSRLDAAERWAAEPRTLSQPLNAVPGISSVPRRPSIVAALLPPIPPGLRELTALQHDPHPSVAHDSKLRQLSVGATPEHKSGTQARRPSAVSVKQHGGKAVRQPSGLVAPLHNQALCPELSAAPMPAEENKDQVRLLSVVAPLERASSAIARTLSTPVSVQPQSRAPLQFAHVAASDRPPPLAVRNLAATANIATVEPKPAKRCATILAPQQDMMIVRELDGRRDRSVAQLARKVEEEERAEKERAAAIARRQDDEERARARDRFIRFLAHIALNPDWLEETTSGLAAATHAPERAATLFASLRNDTKRLHHIGEARRGAIDGMHRLPADVAADVAKTARELAAKRAGAAPPPFRDDRGCLRPGVQLALVLLADNPRWIKVEGVRCGITADATPAVNRALAPYVREPTLPALLAAIKHHGEGGAGALDGALAARIDRRRAAMSMARPQGTLNVLTADGKSLSPSMVDHLAQARLKRDWLVSAPHLGLGLGAGASEMFRAQWGGWDDPRLARQLMIECLDLSKESFALKPAWKGQVNDQITQLHGTTAHQRNVRDLNRDMISR